MKKVCVITGSRAEYGLLKSLLEEIQHKETMELQLVVTGMHLSPEFGLTYKEIERDGYVIHEKVEMLLSSDTSIGVSKSVGLGIIGFTDTFQRLAPDSVIVLGDRYEIFAACSAAMMLNIPIIHLHGGEITEGAIDDSIRHCITKMSQLHFTSTESYRDRVIQLGEQPSRVFNVGALGVENIKKITLLSKQALEKIIQLKLEGKTALVTFHPVTLEEETAEEQFKEVLKALDAFPDMKLIFTKANADRGGRIINKLIDEYTEHNKERAIAVTSLGQLNYLSALQFVDLVIGNSSSGIIEVPSFHIPTINIGNRQKGRVASLSVIQCKTQASEMIASIHKGLSKDFKEKVKKYDNPYEKENTCLEIIKYIEAYMANEHTTQKTFYDKP